MVRRLDKEDIKDLFQLRLEALAAVPTAFGSSFEEESSKGPSWLESILVGGGDANAIFGAFQHGRLVGIIGIYSDTGLKSKHRATIWGMYVRSDCRRMNFGSALISVAVEHAKLKMPARAIYLSVEANNIAAKGLYLKCGFICWGREPGALCVEGRYYDEDHLFLQLRP